VKLILGNPSVLDVPNSAQYNGHDGTVDPRPQAHIGRTVAGKLCVFCHPMAPATTDFAS